MHRLGWPDTAAGARDQAAVVVGSEEGGADYANTRTVLATASFFGWVNGRLGHPARLGFDALLRLWLRDAHLR